jgi:hypothetical protein
MSGDDIGKENGDRPSNAGLRMDVADGGIEVLQLKLV